MSRIHNLKGFRLLLDKFETTCVCFWYIPKNMRGIKEDESWWKTIDTVTIVLVKNQLFFLIITNLKVAPKIKEKMMKSGLLMIGYSPLYHKGWYNFFRMTVTCHPVLSHSDMDYVIEKIQTIGDSL